MIAPVARYAGVWKIPVLTAGGLVENFDNREEYPTLTRMMGSYKLVGEAFRHILHEFGWNVVGMLYYNHGINTLQMGNSKCYFTLSAVFIALGMKPIYKSFHDTDSRESFKELLTEMSRIARSECRPGFIRVIAVAAIVVVVAVIVNNNIVVVVVVVVYERGGRVGGWVDFSDFCRSMVCQISGERWK